MTDAHVHDGPPGGDWSLGERRTRIVVLLSLAMMLLELGAGSLTGSMALVADGWHMATHVGAVGLAWLAYHYGRRGERLGRFAFGPAKVNALAGYTNALLLGGAALLLAAESLHRLSDAPAIRFREALPVAALGLLVNIVAASLLGAPENHHHDHNLRAVYMHVLADIMTSVLAIAALVGGSLDGWCWLDPAAGLVGAAVILVWAIGLARRTGGELMDMTSEALALRARVVAHLESDGCVRVEDVRVWPIGGGAHGCTVRATTHPARSAAQIRERILSIGAFGHLSVEVRAADLEVDLAAGALDGSRTAAG